MRVLRARTRGARGHEGFNIRWLPCSVCVCVWFMYVVLCVDYFYSDRQRQE
jgi:hypothetical protein